MPFMPFHVLGMWLRGVLSLLLLALGLSLLGVWYNHRPTDTLPERGEPPPPSSRQGDTDLRQSAAVEDPSHRGGDGHFGFNWPTALLLLGVALVAGSLGGGLLVPLVFRRRGEDEPRAGRPGTVQRLQRPDGTELAVELYGPEDGPVIVLTHGWGGDSDVWYYARKQLGERHRLVLWDLAGLGRSSRPANNDFSMEKMAADLQAVLSVAGDRPVVLLGHSIGGMILLTFCRLFPHELGQRVVGLVLAHTTYTNPVRTTSMAGLYTALQKPVLEPLCHLMVWLSPVVWLLNCLGYLNGSVHRSLERSSFDGRETRGLLDFLARYLLVDSPAVLARGTLGMLRYDATATLPAISVPTLVVAGDEDPTCVPEASVFMSQTIPDAQLVTLRSARHCGLFEYPGTFHEAVSTFVAGCRPGGAGQ